jgi:RNA ligase (TIGR02306 family)
MRKLASIQKINNLSPIDGADKIEVAQILGWQAVVQKGLYKVGDLVIYCEIDSVLPEWPEFEFMRARKFRVKTIKLRGQISQGLCFPLSILDKYPDKDLLGEGDDVTDLLKIIKYDPELAMNKGGLRAARIRKFPGFVRKTDEVRLQSVPSVLEKYGSADCYVAEKLDGSSFTAYSWDEKVGICSRNMEIENKEENKDNVFYRIAQKYNLFETLQRPYFVGKAIQGEVVGPKIQNNPYRLSEPALFLYSVFDISKQEYCNFEVLKTISIKLNIPTVPILWPKVSLKFIGDLQKFIDSSNGKSVLNPDTLREGIVVRSLETIVRPHRELEHLSFKVISPEFLLAQKD